jgi:manganese transport protein
VFSTALVFVFSLATLGAVAGLQWTPYAIRASDVASGLRFQLPRDLGSAFAAFGIIGVGAAELLYYPYWCLEKGYARAVGPRDGSPGWLDRARGWLGVMRVDAWTSLVLYTAATVAFYLLGAAVLHAKGLRVSNQEMLPTLAHMYIETFGRFGLWIFVAGAFATLYSTAFAGTASNARLLADALGLWGLAPGTDAEARVRRVRLCSVALSVYATLLYLVWPRPVTLILISGTGQALLLPFLGGAALYFRYRRLDPALRPGPVWTSFLWLSAVSLAVAGLYGVGAEIAKRLG